MTDTISDILMRTFSAIIISSTYQPCIIPLDPNKIWKKSYNPHFTDQDNKAEKNYSICLGQIGWPFGVLGVLAPRCCPPESPNLRILKSLISNDEVFAYKLCTSF
jgi:hypothetical protein